MQVVRRVVPNGLKITVSSLCRIKQSKRKAHVNVKNYKLNK
jgi:hypothetical protein